MEDYLAQALSQAAQLTALAAGEPMPQPSGLRGAWCASPAAFALAARRGTDPVPTAEELARTLDLTGSWFDRAAAEQGYLNFHLAPAWYRAVAGGAVEPGPVIERSVPGIPPFPAAIHPGDWRFLCRSGRAQKGPNPALAARQDDGNPAWLVRYTALRMSALADRAGAAVPEHWTPEERSLLRKAAEYPAQRGKNGPQLSRYLVALARQLWQTPNGSGAVLGVCARVLAAGYSQLAG